jgi:regulatory protein
MELKAAFLKAASFCAYQERSVKEVSDKLRQWGLENSEEVKQVLDLLREEKFLDEYRFAASFARGRFRLKKWGRLRISHELYMRQTDKQAIAAALDALDEDEYLNTLSELAQKHLKGKKDIKSRQAAVRFLLTKGYEPELVYEAVGQR